MRSIVRILGIIGFLTPGPGFAEEAAASDRVSTRPELIVTTLGFGSCARQERPQPIWDAINAAGCDAFVLCGDNRVHDRPYTGSNFGLLRIRWDDPVPSLRLEVRGLEGDLVLSRDAAISELR